jgi:cytochrome b561
MKRSVACGGSAAPKYDAVTRWSHAALAIAVVVDLALLSVMRVPPGPGLGVRDWHRQAFELHCRFGPVVAVLCVLHWLWICLPWARPGVAYLLPWMRPDTRAVLGREIRNLVFFELPAPQQASPLVGTVQGLGLCAVTASVIGGFISYLGYFTHIPVSARVLHGCAIELVISSYLVWAFVITHGFMALLHRLKTVSPVF